MSLDTDRTLLIGIEGAIPGTRKRQFFDTFNIYEYNLIVWNAISFISETQNVLGTNIFAGRFNSQVYDIFYELFSARTADLAYWVWNGNVLLLVPVNSPPYATNGDEALQ